MISKKKNESVEIVRVTRSRVSVNIMGTTPLIMNCMSNKAKQTLLLPDKRKTRAEKDSTAKHDPLVEFRDSAYMITFSQAPTLLGLPAQCFKASMREAAVDVPGAFKSQIGRHVYVRAEYEGYVSLYGAPQLHMTMVRQADIDRTPDIRTRVIMPEWAAKLVIEYATPMLKEPDIATLLASAGIITGVCEWRPQKGKGDYGQFEPVNASDPDLKRILKMSRKVQTEAMAHPVCYDHETQQLFDWCVSERRRRGFEEAA